MDSGQTLVSLMEGCTLIASNAAEGVAFEAVGRLSTESFFKQALRKTGTAQQHLVPLQSGIE